MTASEKIQKGKIKLILNNPFYATLALSVVYEENTQIDTACTDGKKIEYNPLYIDKLTLEETQGLLAHEVSHIAFLHHCRRNGRDIGKWNRACDYAINLILVKAGFVLPKGGLVNNAFENLSSEEIYKLIPDDPTDKNNDPGKCGGVKDAPADTPQKLKEIEAETKQLVSQAAMVAKRQGKLPSDLEDLIQKQNEPKVNWKEVLNNFLSENARNDYSFSRPSNRYLTLGLYLPTLESKEKGSFAIIIDTSDSMEMKLLESIWGETQDVLDSLAKSMTVYCVDTKIQSITEYTEGDELKLNVKGRGGTDFKPAFEKLSRTDCQAVVYFTDGYCNSFPEASQVDMPVFWAVYNNKDFNPPFGEVVHID